MGPRPAISAPLPWLAMLAGGLLGRGRRPGKKGRSFFKLPRSLSVTKEGKWYIGVLLLIGVAAINTGNNLLYLVVSTLLSLIIVSGILSESTLRGLKAERELPSIIFKGAPCRGTLKVTNGKNLLPSYSFKITEMDGPAANAYVLKLAPGETTRLQAAYTFTKRGRVEVTGLTISTRFPFGLFTKGKYEPLAGEALVLPSVSSRRTAVISSGREATGMSVGSGRGEGGGLHGIREYTLADDARHIHWKSAARTSSLLLKEFEEEARHEVVVIFENRGEAGEAFEEKVDEAAGTIDFYIERGYSVGLKTLSSDIPPEAGREHLVRLLRELALIEPLPGMGGPSLKVVGL